MWHEAPCILSEASGEKPAVILIGTGSEVHLAPGDPNGVAAEGVPARVVSMPSWDCSTAKQRFLPAGLPKLVVEAGVTRGWCYYVDGSEDMIGLDRFGALAEGISALT